MTSPLWRAAVLAATFASTSYAQDTPQSKSPARPFDPAHYVRIYEETSDRRVLLYDPDRVSQLSTLLRVDADSKIVIEVDPNRLGPDMALNGLFMAAELSRVDPSTGPVKVEVVNYSEVAADPRTQASQAGVALRTAGEVHLILRNLYDLVKDLVGAVFQDECLSPGTGRTRPAGCTYQPRAGQAATDRETELRRHLRAYHPRVEVITDFLTSDRNALVIGEIGSEVFGIDFRSLKAMAAKLKSDVALFIGGDESAQRTRAYEDILLNLQRVWDDMQPLRQARAADTRYFETRWEDIVLPHFRQLLAPGTIDLRRYKAADGETLTLHVQARGAGGEGSGGVTRDFQIAIKKLRTRVSTEPSAFYLRRIGTVLNDQGQPVSTNFSPAPGVTFGPIFYSRGLARAPATASREAHWVARDTRLSRLRSAFAPGIGMNVSLMNFSANDFDPSIKNAAGQVVGGFRTTTSSAVQVGAGVTASLFANAIQVTYGWNLNVSEKRAYWGIGFGFLQIGQEIAKVVKK